MSGAAIGRAIAEIIWKGLRHLVERLGQWVVRELVTNGARALAAYMRIRVSVFRRRLQRVLARRHAAWRPRFLRGRIARWLRGAAWLEEQADHLGKVSADEAEKRLQDLPEESPWEDEQAWRRLVRS
jgi:hypothetical protein